MVNYGDLEGYIVGDSVAVCVEIKEAILLVDVEEEVVIIIDHDSSWRSGLRLTVCCEVKSDSVVSS